MYASNYSSINRSFSSDVMAAMLVYKNNRFSLRWELISIVRKEEEERSVIDEWSTEEEIED